MLSRHLCGHHAIDVLAILARFITRSWSRKERRTKPHPRPAMASCSPLLARPRDLLRCCRLSLEISLAYSPSMHTERDRESERERARETERIRERERERNRQTQADRQAHSEGMANIERGTRGERIERVFVVYTHLFFLVSRLFQSISGCKGGGDRTCTTPADRTCTTPAPPYQCCSALSLECMSREASHESPQCRSHECMSPQCMSHDATRKMPCLSVSRRAQCARLCKIQDKSFDGTRYWACLGVLLLVTLHPRRSLAME